MIRTHLVKALYENLLGPKSGSNEIIEQPYLKYELGILNSSYSPENKPVPPNQKLIDDALNPDINEIPKENIETSSNNENTQGLDHLRRDVDTELSLAKGASSLGLSFVLEPKNNIDETQTNENIIPKFKICLTWGRYTQNLEFGSTPRIFNRHPNFFATDWINPDANFPRLELTSGVNGSIVTHGGVFLHIVTTKIKDSDKWVVRIFLVNESPYDVTKRQKEVDRIFQPQIRIIVNDAGNLGDLDSVNSQDFDEQDEQDKSDALLYHNLRTKAKGYLCAAVWADVDPEYSEGDIKQITWKDSQIVPQEIKDEFLGKTHVRTEYLPLYSILQPKEKEHEFYAKKLSNAWNKKDLENQLRSIEKDYGKWIDLRNEELTKDATLGKISESLKKTGIEHLGVCTKSKEKISNGIDFLIDNKKARAAFCFMNAVMNDNRIYDTRNDENPKGDELNWKEFQMAFILQSLTGVTGESPEGRDKADVLWFPTGGGKTEAYLGIVIFAIAFRRLSFDSNQSNDVTLSNDGGVSVISRYTLRLLTIQQFHRALGVIVVADMRRVMNWLPQDAITGSEKISDPILLKKLDDGTFWGNQRFSIGLWIGNKITPKTFPCGYNRSTHRVLLNCEGALLPQWHEKRKRSESSGDPDQVQNCPVCKNILCIPKDPKINQEFTKITWIVRLSKTKDVLEKLTQELFEDNAIILKTKPVFEIISHPSDDEFYYRLTMEIKPKRNTQSLDRSLIDRWWIDCVKRQLVADDEDDPLQSTAPSMPGYFFLTHGEKRYDFAMFCTNKECELNQVEWFEKLENKFDASIPPAFQIKNSKNISTSVPISAFLYDDMVYSKCPSFLIATVDKFANLPFEPKCASIFGNVDVVHPVFGYGRRSTFESPLLNRSGVRGNIPPQELQDIPGFNPPSLILQDELHLIEGPLGSMMGIYEMAVDVLSDNGLKPKYIASSATIKEAKSQVGTIFRKKVSIFPSPGINSFDNYFSKIEEDPSCIDEKPGRLYLGMLSGKTAVYLPIQAQSIIMAEIFKMREHDELYDLTDKERQDIIQETDPYWTFVSYFTDLSLLSKFTNYYSENIVPNVKKSSSVKILNSSTRVNNQTFPEGLRLFPVVSDKDMSIETVSIFCTNATGRIRIAVYEDGNPIGKRIVASDYKECIAGENNFDFDNKLHYEIKNNGKIWISVINDNSSTEFESVNSQLDSFETNPLQVPDDFPDTFQNLSKLQNNSIKIRLNSPSRFLSYEKNIQLSSETDAQDLVKHLDELQEVSNIDSLQTSPVFGTGIDVTRLGIIQIMNQPKTNSGYIQSSGRVGRNNFGLVLTWLRAGRARDLNHYENFIGYHRMIHKFVEPITASPFSDEAMELCLGPIMVAILRNARNVNGISVSNKWITSADGPDRMRNCNNDNDVKEIRNALVKISQSDEIASFRRMFKEQFETHFDESKARWHRLATELHNEGKDFVYQERTPNAVPEKNVVLGTPGHKVIDLPHAFENASNSLRQTEPAATFYGGLDVTAEIRPSQFITRYGPGTLLSQKYHTFVVPSIQNLVGNLNGKGNFAAADLQGNTGLYKYEVNDSRMKRILLRTNTDINWQKLKLFSLPTNTSLIIPSAEKVYRCDTFPKWVYCTNKVHASVKILAELDYDDGTYVKCPECQRLLVGNDEKSKKYAASTLVIACSEGHLDDVNWPLEIHRGNGARCNGNVFSVISSGDNDNAVIRCMGHWNNDTFVPSTCDSSVDNLELKARSNTGQITCTAKIAETNRDDQHGCTKNGNMSKAKLTNKTQMSIRMPLVATSMEIKPQKSQLFNTLQPLAGVITQFVKTYLRYEHPEKQTVTQDDFVKILRENQADHREITSEVIRKTENVKEDVFTDVIDQIIRSSATPETPLELLSEKEAFEEELSSLETQTREYGAGISLIPGATTTRIRFPIKFSTPWNLTFEAMPFEGVNVTQVQTGYSREISPPRQNSGIDEDRNFDVRIGNIISDTETYKDENDSRWYLANQLRGEGIFIHLDPQVHKDAMEIFQESNNDDYAVWENIHQETLEKNNSAIKLLRGEENNEQKIDAFERQNLQTNPLFVWWHSFAHEFINQLSIDSGFSGVSLGERIYCVKKSDGTFTAGIFIYASSPGTDGTLGGLTSLVDKRILPVIVKKTLHKITSCSNDPICSASKINNQRRTGAACHICLMNSETSCAYLNKYLDRNLVRGTLNG
ncbi:MAG: hypothetical protein IIC67_00075 [Thaumarchaeota archaeon]|nr:hypothetical protein [Nitrososphaerota archaeon]